MRFVSLFTGVGGFDLGFEQRGWECVGQVEINKKCVEVLEHRWPGVSRHDDVTTAIDWAESEGLRGRVDVVCGGFPCQDVSVAGKRAGLAGERTGLFWDALAFAQVVEARWVVLENVPGLLSSNEGRDFGVVVSALADAGYRHIEWRVLDSQFFGVPQRRRRVFIVACAGDIGGRQVLTESESVRGDFAESKPTGTVTTTAITSSLGTGGPDDNQAQGNQLVPVAFSHTQGLDPQPSDFVFPTLRTGGGGMAALTHGAGQAVAAYDELNATTSDIHHTLRAGTSQSTGVLQNMQVRRLTPVECERLQGFPDGWTSVVSDTQRYRQMGNAVTVPVAAYVAECLELV